MIHHAKKKSVALRKESVDRNKISTLSKSIPGVALRKESVDRNSVSGSMKYFSIVALRKESVDRNFPSMHCSSRTVRRSPQGERG